MFRLFRRTFPLSLCFRRVFVGSVLVCVSALPRQASVRPAARRTTSLEPIDTTLDIANGRRVGSVPTAADSCRQLPTAVQGHPFRWFFASLRCSKVQQLQYTSNTAAV